MDQGDGWPGRSRPRRGRWADDSGGGEGSCNYDEDWHFQQIDFYRPDGDVEGKDIGWCLSKGFFMIRPGLWSGPWYFEDFPEARKENCSEEDLKILQQEPTVQRVVENGTNKSLKMSIGIRKLHSSEMNSERKDMARRICNAFVINGVQLSCYTYSYEKEIFYYIFKHSF